MAPENMFLDGVRINWKSSIFFFGGGLFVVRQSGGGNNLSPMQNVDTIGQTSVLYDMTAV